MYNYCPNFLLVFSIVFATLGAIDIPKISSFATMGVFNLKGVGGV